MLIYLDNCCYNRPYDDQSLLSVSLETQAKLYVQELIRRGRLQMVNSYMLEFENSENPYELRRQAIGVFISENESKYVSIDRERDVIRLAEKIMATGVKYKDACHVACAVLSGCEYFLTTDHRLLKYNSDKIRMVDPVAFVKILEEKQDE